MKINLLYENKEALFPKLTKNEEDTWKDLGLEVIFTKMVNGNKFLYDNLKPALMHMERDSNVIYYRQEILKDVIANKDISYDLFSMIDALDNEVKTNYSGIFEQSTSAVVSSSMYLLELTLKKIEDITIFLNTNKDAYKSKGMKSFVSRFISLYEPSYLENVLDKIKYLRFEEGTMLMANLNESLDPTNIKLCKYDKNFKSKMKVKLAKKLEIKAMDEAANKEFLRLCDLGVSDIYETMYYVCSSVLKFISGFRLEFGFYIAGMNLYYRINNELKLCYPLISNTINELEYKNVCDISLCLVKKEKVIGNDLDNTLNKIFIITGANQGGKSTFLRSIGQNFILAQAGLFVAADYLKLYPIDGVYTHFNREEDSSMQSGRLDEELKRMDFIVSNIKTNSLILFNESFSSTNEIEGSKIAYDIIKALSEEGIKVFFVTHMYKLSCLVNDFYHNEAIFFNATRNDDGSRNYHLKLQLPERSSYAMDLYNKIFSNN